MKHHVCMSWALLIVTTALFAATPAPAADMYQVDPGHSSVHFKVQREGAVYVWGRFNELAGTAQWDAMDPANSSIELTIKTESLDSASPGREKFLSGEDFFNIMEFPDMTFKSTSIQKDGEHAYAVTGDFTMIGHTHPVMFTLRWVGANEGRRGVEVGVEAEFVLKRSDFGMVARPDQIADEVHCIVSINAVKQ